MKLFCENNNVIIKKYNHYALNLIHNLKIYENIKM